MPVSETLLSNGDNVVELSGYKLIGLNMDGYNDTEVGFVRDEAVAKKWLTENPTWRRVEPFKQKIVIHATLESLKARQAAQERVKVLRRMTPHERTALGFPADEPEDA